MAVNIDDKSVFIAKRNDNDDLGGCWEFPGGKVESKEDPSQCLEREMREEFGLKVQVGSFLGETIYPYKNKTVRLLAYWTTWKRGNEKSFVHQSSKWIDLSEMKDYKFCPADDPIVDYILDVYK